MTKQTIKNRINNVIYDNTKGFYNDEDWSGVKNVFNQLENKGYEVTIMDQYYDNSQGFMSLKKWIFIVTDKINKFAFQGVLNAHSAGTVNDPMSRYDISCYLTGNSKFEV